MHLPSEQKPTQDCLEISKVEKEITMIVDHEIPSLAGSGNTTRRHFYKELRRMKQHVESLIANMQNSDHVSTVRTLANNCLIHISSMLPQKAGRRSVQ